MFFPLTSFHTFFIMFFTIPFIKAQPLFSTIFIHQVIQMVLHNLGGVKVSVIFSIIVHTMWLNLYIAWLSSYTNFVDKSKFSYSFFVICLPYLLHSLVYQTLYNLKPREMKEFSNGQMDERREFSNGPIDERRRGMKEWTNYNGATGILDCRWPDC